MAIRAEDVEYHTPSEADYTWTETWLFPVVVPDEHLYALVYVQARPVLGVMTNDISVIGALTDVRSELLYYDVRNHLPAPAEFSKLTSPTGLQIEATEPPRNFRVDYVGYGENEIHVDWQGLMEPFDIHDPEHSPHATTAGGADGLAYAKGHFDMTGRATGTLIVRGQEYEVDCIERMDRTWGPRDEMLGTPAMNSISATFGPDLAFHVIARMDPDAPVDRNLELAHGYVLDGDEAYGIQTGSLTTRRVGTVVVSLDMELTDIRGETYDLHASPDIGAPWMSVPGGLAWNSLMHWWDRGSGREGYGVVMENHPMPWLNERFGMRWTDMPRKYTS